MISVILKITLMACLTLVATMLIVAFCIYLDFNDGYPD